MVQLANQILHLPAEIIAVVIDKPALTTRLTSPASPYDLAMETCLDMLQRHLIQHGQVSRITPIVVECRGRREDRELELAFRRVCGGANASKESCPFQLIMAPKSSNSAGLQLADLMARPVGIHHLRPHQPNYAYDIVAKKILPNGLRILP